MKTILQMGTLQCRESFLLHEVMPGGSRWLPGFASMDPQSQLELNVALRWHDRTVLTGQISWLS